MVRFSPSRALLPPKMLYIRPSMPANSTRDFSSERTSAFNAGAAAVSKARERTVTRLRIIWDSSRVWSGILTSSHRRRDREAPRREQQHDRPHQRQPCEALPFEDEA